MRDVIVVGGGHNGLVAAAYLAGAGLKVTVLERRAIVGGAAATEEFHPGFRNSVAAYAVSLLHPTIIRDLDLEGSGLKIVERPLSNFLPLPDGRYLKASPGRTRAEVAKFSARDAERLDDYDARLERMADALRAIALETPPNAAAGRGLVATLREVFSAARAANRLRPLGLEGQRDLLEIFTRSAGDCLDQWFESDPIKAILGFDGIVGTYASPYAAGTGYVLLHHCFGETNGRKGVWGHAIGGMGAITQAMARVCAARGVDDPHQCGGQRNSRANGRVAGVVTDKGERFATRAVVSNLHPKLTFERLTRSFDAAGRLSRPHRLVAECVRRVPHESRARRTAELLLPAGPRSGRASRRRHRDRAEPRLYGARMDGRAPVRLVQTRRLSRCSFLPCSTTRLRRRGGMSPRCSASMWRRSCRTDVPGTNRAKRSPI